MIIQPGCTKVVVPKNDRIDQVFVYGTLKESQSLHDSIKDGKRLGLGSVHGYLFHLGVYPALVLAEGAPRVYGEIYKVTPDLLDRLDGIEGVASGHYTRAPIQINPFGPTWTYVYPYTRVGTGQIHSIIPGGSWHGRHTETQAWAFYMNNNPHLPTPGKPHTMWDPKVHEYCVIQPGQAGNINSPGGVPFGARTNLPVLANTTPEVKKEVLGEVPEEWYEAIEGIEVGWA